MQNITIINCIFVLIGIALHVLLGVEESKQSFGVWISNRWVSLTISLICGFLSLYFIDVISQGLGIKIEPGAMFYQFHALGSGYLGRDMVLKALNKEKTTRKKQNR